VRSLRPWPCSCSCECDSGRAILTPASDCPCCLNSWSIIEHYSKVCFNEHFSVSVDVLLVLSWDDKRADVSSENTCPLLFWGERELI
jgi:hypothetical protein